MWKKLSIIFAIQTAVFTITTGFDQFTQGSIQIFFSQKRLSIANAIIVFWVMPLLLTVVLEVAVRTWKTLGFIFERLYLSWKLRKNRIWRLTPIDLANTIHAANQKGLITRDELDKLEKMIPNLDGMNLFILDYLDDPFTTLKEAGLPQTAYRKESYYSLLILIFPFLQINPKMIQTSVHRLFESGLITIEFDDFRYKTLSENKEIYCTSPLGRKFIFLLRKELLYS